MIVHQILSRDDLREMALKFFGDMVKGVADVKRRILALDAELHSDLELELLGDGSEQEALWGINLYPDETEEKFVEFDSVINLRPMQGNRIRGVSDAAVRDQIREVVSQWIGG